MSGDFFCIPIQSICVIIFITMLKEIRIHGRGGQGVVTLAELIALSAYYDGKKVQAFPSFGVERRGAPIESFVRISDHPITRRDQIINPNYLIILDETLLPNANIYQGIEKGDMVLVNSCHTSEALNKYFSKCPGVLVKTIDATNIGLKYLGKPIVNTAVLGAFAAITNLIGFNSLQKALQERFSTDILEKNLTMASEAYNLFSQKKIKPSKSCPVNPIEVYEENKINIIS